MNSASDIEAVELAKGRTLGGVSTPILEKNVELKAESFTDSTDSQAPTEEDLATLRRVSAKIPWTAYTIGFVEFCERFSYYGTTAVFVNFIQRPLPEGSNTGAGFDGQSGALGMGQRASTGLTTFNSFWAYVMPLVGAYVADAHLGRMKTIQYALGFALVGHLILISSAAPSVIVHPKTAIGVFSLGLIIMGMGTGGFKSNISPLLAEQQVEQTRYVKTLASGERVIVDPIVTTQRMFVWFYFLVNCGSLTGSIGMVYAEKYVGFWLSFLLPTIMFLFCPVVLLFCRKRYTTRPPTGSVVATFFKLWRYAGQHSGGGMKALRSDAFWDHAKPSNVPFNERPAWMHEIDDKWVDEVRRGLKACTVFLWYPVYWLAYNQMTGNLTSQAATMELNGVPNDIISNLNPLSIILFIPLMDFIIYPALRRAHINFTPLKRIFAGFILAALSMVAATVTQHYIYLKHPCGDHPNTCSEELGPAPINVWVQALPYCLIGFSEIFASITGLEYAFTKAPKNMRSLVTAIFLFMSAISSAISQAFVSLSDDPLLVWNYGIVTVLAAVGGALFWISHRKLDKEEDKLNWLAESKFVGKKHVPLDGGEEGGLEDVAEGGL